MAKTEPTQQKSELSQWDERIALIARVIAALAGSVALIYAVGFAIINLSLLKYGVFEVGVVRERFLQAGAIYLLVLVLLASMALATAYASGKVVEHRLWPALLLCLLPILAISFVLTGLAYNFEFDASVIEMWTVPAWYVGTGFVILAIILGWLYVGRLLTEDKSETTRLLKRLAGWGILLSAMILLLFIYGTEVYGRFPTAYGGGRPIFTQFAGEEEQIALLEEMGIPLQEAGMTRPVELLTQTDTSYIVLLRGPTDSENQTVSFEKSFVDGIIYNRAADFQLEYLTYIYVQRAAALVEEGRQHLIDEQTKTRGRNKVAMATVLYERALELDKEHIGALLGTGESLMLLGDYDTALASFLRVEELDPRNARAQYELARAFALALGAKTQPYSHLRYDSQSVEDERSELWAALKFAIESDENYREEAKSDVAFDEFRLEDEFLDIVFLGAENAIAWYGQEGNSLLEAGDLTAAAEDYKLAVSLTQNLENANATRADYHHRLGGVLLAQDKLSEAVAEFGQAVKLSPDNEVFQASLAEAYVAQASRDGHIGIDKETIDLFGGLTSWSALFEQVGHQHFDAGDLAAAENAYRFAILLAESGSVVSEDDPESVREKQNKENQATYRYRLANVLLAQERLPEAAEQLELATELDDRNPTYYLLLAETYFAQGLFDKAAVKYLRTTELKDDLVAARVGLGNSYLALGIADKAILEYEKSIEIDPGNSQAYCGLARAQARLGNIRKVVQNLRQAVGLDINCRENAEAELDYVLVGSQLETMIAAVEWNEQGDQLAIEGKLKEAIEAYQRAVELDPDFGDAYCSLALTYHLLKQDAVDTLTQCEEKSQNLALIDRVATAIQEPDE